MRCVSFEKQTHPIPLPSPSHSLFPLLTHSLHPSLYLLTVCPPPRENTKQKKGMHLFVCLPHSDHDGAGLDSERRCKNFSAAQVSTWLRETTTALFFPFTLNGDQASTDELRDAKLCTFFCALLQSDPHLHPSHIQLKRRISRE